ncbi:MAG: carboxypeptidase M32, partial [Gemmatimonadetes bacterium]|nr:carboxypeptidase M32 [Gemmatimonadota bacterium]
MSESQYSEFCERVREMSDLGYAGGMLSWDQETCMPKRGAQARAQALGSLAGLYHE